MLRVGSRGTAQVGIVIGSLVLGILTPLAAAASPQRNSTKESSLPIQPVQATWAVATPTGAEVHWAPAATGPQATGYSITDCGPWAEGARALTTAIENGCRSGSPHTAESPSARSATVPCLATATTFCVIDIVALENSLTSTMATLGTGGVAPVAPSGFHVVPDSDGQGLDLSWTAPPLPSGDAQGALSYEVTRNGVVVASHLTTTNFVDEGCGFGQRCQEVLDAATPGGRSATLTRTVVTLGSKAPTVTQFGPLLQPGVSIIKGNLGNGSGDARPVTVTLTPSVPGVQSPVGGGGVGGTTVTLPAVSSGSTYSVLVPSTVPPGTYNVTAAQGSFSSTPVTVAVATKIALSATLGGTTATPLPQVLGPSAALSGTAMATPPGSVVSVSLFLAPAGTSKTTPLSSATLRQDVTSGSPWSTSQVNVSPSGKWATSLIEPSTRSMPVIVAITQASAPGMSQTPIYLEMVTSSSSVPSVPTAVGAMWKSGTSNVVVQWQAPQHTGGAPLTGYVATLSPGGATCSAGPIQTSCTIKGVAGGNYVATVTSANIMGSSSASNGATVLVGTRPPGPPVVSAAVVNGQLSVSWQAATAPGITSYVATAQPGGASCTYVISVGPEQDTCTIAGLTLGTRYVVSVAAVQSDGVTSLPTSSTPVLDATVPSVPVGLSATAIVDGWVEFSWSPSAANGGTPITTYVLSLSGGGTICETSLTTCQAQLTSGQSYVATLVAVNQIGSSTPATVSFADAMLPFQPFQPSTSLDGQPAGSLEVQWPANPTTSGTSPPTGYTATASPGGQTCTVPFSGASTYSCVLSGLAPGSTVTVTLVATNAAGTTAPSPPSWPLTLPGVPSSPLGVSATPSDGAALVSWLPPQSTGGSAITSYTVTASPGGQTCSEPVRTPEVDSCTVEGLTDGATVTFSVTASNSFGASAPSSSSPSILVGAPPSPPTHVSATGLDQGMSVSWNAPVAPGGTPVSSYTATATPGGATCTALAPNLSCSLLHLTVGTTYSVSVTATNQNGVSLATQPVSLTVATLPQAPSGVSIAPLDGGLQVSWLASVSSGGSPLLSYTATASPGGHSCTEPVGRPEVDSCTISGLVDGTVYSVTVTATTAIGSSPVASTAVTATPGAVPSPPQSVVVTPQNGSLSVQWSPPSHTYASPVVSYTATATPGGASCTAAAPATTCSLPGLVDGATYGVTVTATNAFGASAPSTSLPGIPVGPPSIPQNVSAQIATSSLVVSWTPPTQTNGSAITSYLATAEPGGATCTSTVSPGIPEVDSCRITGLTNGVSYAVTVTATSKAGTSNSSASITATPAGPPGAPTNVTASVADLSSVVAWTAPTLTGGSPVTSYTATASPGGASCSAHAPQTSCTLTGLSDGTTYNIAVTATSTGGTSNATTTSVTPFGASWAARVPSAPSAVSVSPSDSSLTVSWTAPTDTGGGALHFSTVTLSPGGNTCLAQGAATTCTVTGVDNFALYTATVTSTNAKGTSGASLPSSTASYCGLSPSAPCYRGGTYFDPPGHVSAVTSGSSVIVSFSTPSQAWNMSRLSGITYTVTGSPSPASCSVNQTAAFVAGWQCTISGTFSPAETYRVVASAPAYGTSAPSFPVAAVDPTPSLSAPAASSSPSIALSDPGVAADAGALSGTLSIIATPSSCAAQPVNCVAEQQDFSTTFTGATTLPLTTLTSGSWQLNATYVITGAGGQVVTGSLAAQSELVELLPPQGLSVSAVGNPLTLAFGQEDPTGKVTGSFDCDPKATLNVTWYAGTTATGTPIATDVPSSQLTPSCTFADTLPGVGTSTPDGTYTVVASETNQAGLTANATILVNVKTKGPQVAFASSAATSTVPAGLVALNGTGTNGLGDSDVTVEATNGSTHVTGTAAVRAGVWSLLMTLTPGSWTVTASRQDLDGRSGSSSTTLDVVTGAPLTFLTPSSSATVSTSPSLVLSAQPGSLVKVAAGTALQSAHAGSDGLATVTFPQLPAGSTTFVATDSNGDTATLSVVVGGTVPFSISSMGPSGTTRANTLVGSAPSGDRISCSTPVLALGTATSSGGTWSRSLAGVSDGVVTITCVDGLTSSSVSFVIDRTPPALSLTGPTGTTASRFISVTATNEAGDEPDATISYFAGSSATGTPTTTTEQVITGGTQDIPLPNGLADGVWTVAIQRVDAAGNSTTATETFVLDATIPHLSVQLPTFARGPLTIAGTASTGPYDLVPTVSLDGGQAVSVTETAGGIFTYPTSVTSGTHVVTVSQSNQAGLVTSTTQSITVEATGPTLTFTTASGLANVQIGGAVTGNDGGNVELMAMAPGGAVEASTVLVPAPDGSWSWSPTLSQGPVTIVASSADAAGLLTTASTSFVVDTTPPSLTLSATPAEAAASSVTIGGTSSNDAWRPSALAIVATPASGGAAVDASSTVASDGTWQANVTLSDGTWTLTVTRPDPGGVAVASTTLVVDAHPPSLTMSTPSGTVNKVCGTAGTATLDTAHVTVAFTANGNVTNVAATPVNGSFCASPPSDGTWHVVATQNDAGGGSSVVNLGNVAFQVTPPALVVNPVTALNTALVAHEVCDFSAPDGTLADCAPRTVSSVTGTAGASNFDAADVSVVVASAKCSVASEEESQCPLGASQTLSATVQSDGTFSVPTSSLADGTYYIESATQSDIFGNVGSWASPTCWWGLDGCQTPQYFFTVSHAVPTAPALQSSSGTYNNVLSYSWCPSTADAALPLTGSIAIYSGTSTTGSPVKTIAMYGPTCGSQPWMVLSMWQSGSGLPDGTYTAVGQVTDGFETASSAPLTFVLNSTLPAPTVTGVVSAASGTPSSQATFGSAITLVGTASMLPFDAASVSIAMTEQGNQAFAMAPVTASVGTDGSWNWSPPNNLAPGTYCVTVTQDNRYQSASGSGCFTITGAAPTVSGYTVGSGGVTFYGQVPEGRPLDYFRVNYSGAATGSCENWWVAGATWYCNEETSTMPNGTYSVTIHWYTPVWTSFVSWWDGLTPKYATSVGDQDDATTRSLLVDTLAPQPTITSPAFSWPPSTVASPVAIQGTASTGAGDATSVTVSASGGGTPVTTTATVVNGTWSTSLALPDADWTLSVTQGDQGGLSGTSSVEVAVDTTPPSVAISYPAPGSTVTSAFIGGTITGSPGNQPAADAWENAKFSAGTISFFPGSHASGTPTEVDQISNCAVCTRFMAVPRADNGFTDQPNLAPGTWTAVVAATSSAGVTATSTVTFTLAPTATTTAQFPTTVSIYPDSSTWASVFDTPLGSTAATTAGTNTYSVEVAGNGIDPSPTGTVAVSVDGTVVGNVTLSPLTPSAGPQVGETAGWADLTIPMAVGVHSLIATYNGDGAAQSSSSLTTSITVSPHPVTGGGARLTLLDGAGVVEQSAWITLEGLDDVTVGLTWGAGQGQCYGGNVTITNSSGVVVAQGPLGAETFSGNFEQGAWLATATLAIEAPLVAGAQNLTATLDGTGTCSGTLPLSVTAAPTPMVLGTPTVSTSTPGLSDPVVISGSVLGPVADSAVPVPSDPVNLVTATGIVVATASASQANGWTYSFSYSPTVVGTQQLSIESGGAGTSFSAASASVTLAVEPSRVTLGLTFSPSPSHPGQQTTGTLAIAPTGASGSVTVASATSSVTWPVTCTTTCSASGSLPADLVNAVGASVTATYVSPVTGHTYTVTAVVPRTPWQPVLTIKRGAGAPLDLMAQAGDGEAMLSWSDPAPNDSVISSYVVTATPGGATCTAAPGATSCMVTGLTDGTNYTFGAATVSNLGTSGTTTTSTTPVAGLGTPTALAPLATASPNTVARDEVVPVVATATFPADMPPSMRAGSLALTSSPGPDCVEPFGTENGQLGEFSMNGQWIPVWNYCTQTTTTVSADLATANVASSAPIESMSPSGTASWSGNTLTLSALEFVGGMDFTLNASLNPATAGTIDAITATASLTGVGEAHVSIALGAATLTGGCYAPSQNQGDVVSNCYYGGRDGSQVLSTEGFGADTTLTVGQTAYVKATLDPVLATPTDLRQGYALKMASSSGTAAYAVQHGIANGVVETTSAPTASVYPAAVGGSFDTPLGTVDCVTCIVWPLRNVTNEVDGATTPGGLAPGDTMMAVMGYSDSPFSASEQPLTPGSSAEVADRTSETDFHLTVNQADTEQSTKVALVGPDLEVLTAARWPGLEPEVSTQSSDITAEVLATLANGTTESLAYCLYGGWCASQSPTGTAYPPASALPVAGGLALQINLSSYTGPSLQGATFSVETSAPWGQTIDSPAVTPSAAIGVSDPGSSTSSLNVTAGYLGTQLERPDLSSPLPFLTWTDYSNMVSFWQSIFGDGAAANDAISFTLDTINALVGPVERVGNDLIQIFEGNMSAFADLGMMAGIALLAFATDGLATIAIGRAATVLAPYLERVAGGVIRKFFTSTAERLTLGAGAATRQASIKVGQFILARTQQGCSKLSPSLFSSTPVQPASALIKETDGSYFSSNSLECVSNVAQSIAGSLGGDPSIAAAESWDTSLAAQMSAASANAQSASTDIGYGTGVAMEYAQDFAAVVQPSIQGAAQWSPAELASATVHISLWTVPGGQSSNLATTAVDLGEIASCHLDGAGCTSVNGIAISQTAGGFLVDGQFPQSYSWAPPGAYIRAIVTLPVTQGSSSSSGAPGAPVNLSVSGGAGSLTATWSPPQGGPSVSSYTVTASSNQSCTTTSTSCTITGLTTGATTTISVQATNGAGTSQATSETVGTWGFGDVAFPMNKYPCTSLVLQDSHNYGSESEITMDQNNTCIAIQSDQAYLHVAWTQTYGDQWASTYGSLPWLSGWNEATELAPETTLYRSTLPW